MVERIIAQIGDNSDMKDKPKYIADMERSVAKAIGSQFLSSKEEMVSVALASAPDVKTNNAKKAVKGYKDKGISSIQAIQSTKAEEFVSNYGDKMYNLATAKNPNSPVAMQMVHFSVQISNFCISTLGVIDNIRRKTITDIRAFVKRTNEKVRENSPL